MRPRPALALVASLISACAGPAPNPSPEALPGAPARAPEEVGEPAPDGPSPGTTATARREPTPVPPATEPSEPEPVERQGPPPWEGSAEVESNAGSYQVRYRSAPDPIPWGEPFALEVWVLDGKGAPSRDAALSVDAAMPEHGHGMNRVPEVTRAGEGFLVEGMLFHMPGRWELYLDVTEGALTERAQLEVLLD